MTSTVETRRYSVKETAAELRKALKARWPGVRFSVRMSTGTGHGWLRVGWTDGPPEEAVRAVCHGFQSAQFNGMTDGYDRVEPKLYAAPDGSLVEHRWSCDGVNTHRRYSDEAEANAAAVAVPGSRWWRDDQAPWMFDPAFYGTRQLLSGLDLSDGWPEDPRGAWLEFSSERQAVAEVQQ